ncbi:MAG: hypothetical protein A2281_11130 [Bacteroidetes bacterium RIFOXYA12_FULL_38_20]|uniref:Uncharacterized protein n=1 Tax=Candidatus Uhrbacteria bacterium GW2011_GWF2_44_350 TaxID=1619000 RepID=A0A0G1LTB0_9BACT|nr:MAG: hypothetical protein UW63_C0001G0014 [Candidatus Uhrbacteria bacterium GW2011_GWF2_44_350]OFY78669.1 MAG: hypothetical protein A2281_11130 [Bacteroidetes bacterium RIFOXYA12_FULL_38_20]
MALQYNKLYQSLKKVSGEWHAGHFEWYFYWDFLKFYENGIVISCNNNKDDLNDINDWFNVENEKAFFNKGTYLIKGNSIEINISVAVGSIKYYGEISNNYLIVSTINESVGYKNIDFFELTV